MSITSSLPQPDAASPDVAVPPIPMMPVDVAPDGDASASSGSAKVPTSAAIDRSDALSDGIAILLVLTVVQRLVGFARGMLFCRWMSPDELGRWDLSFSFLLLAAPLVVLGLPGSFGRYAEYFRHRGQLRAFLRRTSVATLLLAVTGVAVIATWRGAFGWLLFQDTGAGPLVLLLAVCLLAVIVFNGLVEMFTALRRVRVVTMLQFANSLAFALIALGLLHWWRADAAAVVAGYGAACVITSLAAVGLLWQTWSEAPVADRDIGHSSFWGKLLPFALWVWVANTLSNLFDVTDRYMIVHFSGVDSDAAVALVGNYHSSRVVPVLLVSIATLLSTTILPYLSHQWEAGRRDRVGRYVNLAIKLVGLLLTAGGIVVLALAPVLFDMLLEGKFHGGRQVLPLTLTYCVWMGMSLVALNYLWCAEQVKVANIATAIGLAANVVLNLLLLPRFGLAGAVLATALANGVLLVLMYLLSRMMGMSIDRGTWAVSALVPAMCLGPAVAAVAWIVVVAGGWYTGWLFDAEEKQTLGEVVKKYRSRLGWRSASG